MDSLEIISKINHREAQRFLKTYFLHRKINKEIYRRIPEEKFDFRMVDTPQRNSDTPRESLAHQINVEKTYLQRASGEKVEFERGYDQSLKTKSKQELLQLLDKEDQELIDFLSDGNTLKKTVVVRWSSKPISVLAFFWSMVEHEILHTGWNLALMDHLNIKRFTALKKMWG